MCYYTVGWLQVVTVSSTYLKKLGKSIPNVFAMKKWQMFEVIDMFNLILQCIHVLKHGMVAY
jgi:hypothetical protein